MLSKPQQGSTGQPNPLKSDDGYAETGHEFPSFVDGLRAGYEACGFDPQKGLLLCISGGSDSVALLHGTLNIHAEHRNRIVVAHVNHGLRGGDSVGDAEFVEQLATEKQLACEQLSIEPGELSGESSTASGRTSAVEERARKMRYSFFADVARKRNLEFIATAHHKEDQAETVLHHIVRGSGIRGLAGMRRSRRLSDETALIRPMLEVGKDEIVGYLTSAGLDYREDRSNSDLTFTRNRIRHQLLPLLERQFNIQAASQLASLGQQAADTLECLDDLADRILTSSILEQQADSVRIDQQRLREWPLHLVRHTLTLLWTRQAWPRKRMTFGHWDSVATAAIGVEAFARDLPGGVSVRVERGVVRCIRRAKQNGKTDEGLAGSDHDGSNDVAAAEW